MSSDALAAARLGVIGGSGFYEMEGLTNVRTVTVETPFGSPSGDYVTGELDGLPVAFLPRHGEGHAIPPTALNVKANIWGFKSLGVRWLVSISAVGSMKEEIEPLHVVVPDQLFDRTRERDTTFFNEAGLVVHIGFADPFCPTLSGLVAGSAEAAGATVHRGGTYICIEGPQFSTQAESEIFRGWGVDVIGMTAIPEAKMAREAELHYATLAMSTDYDVWKGEPVSVEMVVQKPRQERGHGQVGSPGTRAKARRLRRRLRLPGRAADGDHDPAGQDSRGASPKARSADRQVPVVGRLTTKQMFFR